MTARAEAAGVSATPTVLVAGVPVEAESWAITFAVDQVSAVDLSAARRRRPAGR